MSPSVSASSLDTDQKLYTLKTCIHHKRTNINTDKTDIFQQNISNYKGMFSKYCFSCKCVLNQILIMIIDLFKVQFIRILIQYVWLYMCIIVYTYMYLLISHAFLFPYISPKPCHVYCCW